MTYDKKRLYLVVNGIEISITSSCRRISILEDYLMENNISRNAITYQLDEQEFLKFQDILSQIVKGPCYNFSN